MLKVENAIRRRTGWTVREMTAAEFRALRHLLTTRTITLELKGYIKCLEILYFLHLPPVTLSHI